MKMYQKIKKCVKFYLYGSCPGFAGSFPYFNTKVYFPKNSYLFKRACEEGIYEIDNTQLLCQLVKPNSVYFDVGANIGLMAAPVLDRIDNCTVVSFEPSPNTLPFLKLTAHKSPYSNRWRVVDKGVSNEVGTLSFSVASAHMGAFDGFQDTKRAGATSQVNVPVTTLDTEWEAMGKPLVSVIKLDVEGAEFFVLQGAINCIKSQKPHILLEWNLQNLKAYSDCKVDSVFTFIKELGYQVYSLPNLYIIPDAVTFCLQLIKHDVFLLTPAESNPF